MCYPIGYGQSTAVQWSRPVALARSQCSFLQGIPLSQLWESSFPGAAAVKYIPLQQAWMSYAPAVSQRRSVSTTTILVQRICILFLPNSSAAHPFKSMKGATKFALAWIEYSTASSSEKPGKPCQCCLPFPKRSKFFCSDMSCWILTVVSY